MVSLVGPPGMGKSRLLTEFGRRLEPDQVTWVLGQCLAYGQAMPYLPVRDLVQQVCALAAGDPLETRAAAVQRRLAALGGVVEEDVALVLQLLDLPVAPELLARLPPETRQARTFALLGHLLRHAAQHQRLVLAVENVHWIDPTSAAWLGFLIERLAGMAVLLLLTQRPGAQPPWGTHVAVTQLALPPLRAEESQVIVAAVPGTAQLPASRCQQIVAHGAGNPFFVEELAWHAVEHGLSATPVAVPKTVHAVLAARIDRLPAAAKALLQTAAVIGPEVPVPLVQAVTELPEDALQQCLAHLQATELLYETRLFPERAFTFKHALTHEVAYGSLLQERRQVLHARIVEALAALAPDQVAEQVERLAHHALRGEVWDKALAYGRQAGIKAGKRSATREAVMCFEQALGALQHLPESSDIHEQAIDLRFYLVDALFPLGELTQGFEHLCAAQTLAEAMDDQRRLGRVYSIMTLYFWLAGDYARALASGQRALAIAQALDDFPLQVRTHFFLGITYHALGEYCRAIEVLRWNVASLDGELIWRSLGMQGLPAVLSRSWLVWCLAEGGTFAEGIARGAEGYRIAEAADNPFSLVVAYFSVSNLYVCKGEVHQAIPVLERSLEIFRTGDLPVLFPYVASLLEPV